MAFYIIEKSSQLPQLNSFGDCFIDFIPCNNNFHPILNPLSLIYIRSLKDHKGYIFCLNHNESLSLYKAEVFDWIEKNTDKLFVLNKKQALHWFYYPDKLFDINFIESVNMQLIPNNNCISYYYSKYSGLSDVNCLIPISKHYEEKELLFDIVLPIIKKYRENDEIYYFNNNRTTQVFYEIETQGIKVSKSSFINYYKNSINHPEYNLYKGKMYTQYNLYTTTSRPSNTFNSINFAALNKEDGERECYIPENDILLELDIQGMHPRLIGNLVNFNFPKDQNTYGLLGKILEVDAGKAKELTFKQLYGGVWQEYLSKPFFKEVNMYIDGLWDTFNYGLSVKSENRIFTTNNIEKPTPQKVFNYIIQSYETSTNVRIIEQILNLLKTRKTKLILYTYDSFLFDFDKNDKDVIEILINTIDFPFNIKQGKSYHGLIKI